VIRNGPTASAARSSAELPVLRLGLAGFARDEEATLCVELAWRATERGMAWQVGPLGEADAWCVNGSRLRRLPDGTWRIAAAHDSERSVRINPDEVDWPIAFSMPAGPPDLDAAYRFELDSPESIQALLDQLEGWLRPVMLQFSLASYIVQQNVDLTSGVYHVTVNGKLYALVSRRAGIGVWPIANPLYLAQAVWHHRPDAADTIPGTFMRVPLAEAMWQYATRTTRDCLPPHYRRKRLYLRRPPPLPLRMLSNRTLLLVRELTRSPGSFGELLQRTAIPGAELGRLLAALYMVGSVTANPKRLASAHEPGWNSSLTAAQLDGDGDGDGCGAEATVRLKLTDERPEVLE
jgi:hypothetical protein